MSLEHFKIQFKHYLSVKLIFLKRYESVFLSCDWWKLKQEATNLYFAEVRHALADLPCETQNVPRFGRTRRRRVWLQMTALPKVIPEGKQNKSPE